MPHHLQVVLTRNKLTWFYSPNNLNRRRWSNIGYLPSHDTVHVHDCTDPGSLKSTVFLVFLNYRHVGGGRIETLRLFYLCSSLISHLYRHMFPLYCVMCSDSALHCFPISSLWVRCHCRIVSCDPTVLLSLARYRRRRVPYRVM